MLYINFQREGRKAVIHEEGCPQGHGRLGGLRIKRRGYRVGVRDLRVARAVARVLESNIHYAGCCHGDRMTIEAQAPRTLRELARQVFHIVSANSGEGLTSGQCWGFFVEGIPHDRNLRELAQECFDALPDRQKREFVEHLSRQRPGG